MAKSKINSEGEIVCVGGLETFIKDNEYDISRDQ